MNNLKYIIIGALVLVVIYFFSIKPSIELNKLKREKDLLQKEILAKDTLQKIADGKYSKLVDNMNTEQQLNQALSVENITLSDSIKKRKERILSIDKTNITFNNKNTKSQIIANPQDSTYSFSSYYPDKNDSFIEHDGVFNLKNKVINDKWKFNNIDVNVVISERTDGVWDSYLDGPDFIKVNSIKVNSIPAEKYVPTSEKIPSVVFYLGGGVRSQFTGTNKDLLIKGAFTVKNKFLFDVDLGTDKKVGAGVLFKF